jgi:hypothetical protein
LALVAAAAEELVAQARDRRFELPQRIAGQGTARGHETEEDHGAVGHVAPQILVGADRPREPAEQELAHVGDGPMVDAPVTMTVLELQQRAGREVARAPARAVVSVVLADEVLHLVEQCVHA